MTYKVMRNRALEIINDYKDFNPKDYPCCTEDNVLIVQIMYRVNYLRHQYISYQNDHPDSTIDNDPNMNRMVERLAKILPSFAYLSKEE